MLFWKCNLYLFCFLLNQQKKSHKYQSSLHYTSTSQPINQSIFFQINGLSNKYWGWGKEDDEFYVRMKEANLTVSITITLLAMLLFVMLVLNISQALSIDTHQSSPWARWHFLKCVQNLWGKSILMIWFTQILVSTIPHNIFTPYIIVMITMLLECKMVSMYSRLPASQILPVSHRLHPNGVKNRISLYHRLWDIAR